jgi:hypothetical protein
MEAKKLSMMLGWAGALSFTTMFAYVFIDAYIYGIRGLDLTH